MKKLNVMKRTLAGVLAVLTVAGYAMPANVGGFITQGNDLVAYADDSYHLSDAAVASALGSMSEVSMVLIGTSGVAENAMDATSLPSGTGIVTKTDATKTVALILYTNDQSANAIKTMLKNIKFTSAVTQVHIDVTKGTTSQAIIDDLVSTDTTKVTFGVLNSNGEAHAYKLMEAPKTGGTHNLTWNQAFVAAVTGEDTLGGMKGYLATVTSQDEANILYSFYQTVANGDTSGAWIAATSMLNADNSKITHNKYSTTNDYINSTNTTAPASYAPYFYWACGPEEGKTVPTNLWNTNEPNNSGGEQVVVASYSGTANFNDFPKSKSDAYGYFLEFSVYADGMAAGTSNNTATISRVQFATNGATSGTLPATQEKLSGSNLTLATNSGSLKKTGYVFAGWNTKADGTGDHYDAGAAYTADKPVTLYAQWAQPSIKTQPTGFSMTYGATGKTLSVAANAITGCTLSYQWYCNSSAIDGATGATYTIPSDKAVSETGYSYYCVVKATDSIGVTATVQSSAAIVTIAKATPEVTAAPTLAGTTTYNGNKVQLITNGCTVTCGTMLYGISTNSDTQPTNWYSDITSDYLKATNAGTYYVWYKVDATSNYNAVAATKTGSVKIAKATPTVAVTLATDVGRAIIQSVSNNSDGKLYFRVLKDGTQVKAWTEFTSVSATNYIPASTATGLFTVEYYVAEGTNYIADGSSSAPHDLYLSKMAARDLDLKASHYSFPNGYNYGSNGEVESNLTDLNQSTKLCVTRKSGSNTISSSNPISVLFSLPENAGFVLNGNYTMTTGNDTAQYSGRNPKSWKIEGLNKETGAWETIVTETNNNGLASSNWSVANFTFTKQNKVFTQLRVSFTQTGNTTEFQLSEMFFGGKAMQNPTAAFSVKSAVTYDGQAHDSISMTSYNGGTRHYVYKRNNATSWTTFNGSAGSVPSFTEAGTYQIGWYSDIDYDNGFYASGSATAPNVIGTFTINPYTISTANGRITATTNDQNYTGSAITTAANGLLTVKDNVNGTVKTLVEGTDYTLAYSNNVNANSTNAATITITGKGNYAGTLTRTFNIRAELNITDVQDATVAKSDRVREVITSVAYDANGNNAIDAGETTTYDTDTPCMATKYNFLPGRNVVINSKAKLVFTNAATNAVLNMNETFDNTGYTYTFTVPVNINVINVKREYNYSFESKGLQLFAKDANVANDYAVDRLVATLKAEDFEYQQELADHVNLTVQEDFELPYETSITYTSEDGDQVQNPSKFGTYHVTAVVSTNHQDYQINADFEITGRNYAEHSGAKATDTDAMAATLNFADNKTTYNGSVQTPGVTITDKLGTTTTPLDRDTDYELGYLDANGKFVVVEPDDDAEKFGHTNVGTYKVYVHFIGNYMNKVNNQEEYVELDWQIVPAAITADDVVAPTAATLTYNTEARALFTNDGKGSVADNAGEIYYRLGTEGEYTTVVPQATNAGVYTVYWYVKGDSNHLDYTAAGDANKVTVTISPKEITPTVVTSSDTFIYDGTAKTFTTVTVKDGDTVIPYDENEYKLTYTGNTAAGTAKLTVSDNLTGSVENGESGNYTIKNPVEVEFSIAHANAAITIEPKATITYDGAVVDDSDFTVVHENTDETAVCELSYFADNEGEKGAQLEGAPKNAGTYWVVATVESTANFNTLESEPVQFTIAPKDISGENVVSITVDEANETPANGTTSAVPTAITVKDTALQEVLAEGEDKDYTVAYSETYDAGEGTITVTGKGNYTGTATGTFNALSALDISAVKDMITSIKYQGATTEPGESGFADSYNYRTGKEITIVSKGVLKFDDLKNVTYSNTNSGHVYKFTIPAGTNLTTVTHIFNYKTSQTNNEDGTVTIWGIDNNIKNNTTKVKIATLKMNPVYYLDDADDKVELIDEHATSVEVKKGAYTYTLKGDSASLDANGKPVNVGEYSVKVRVDVKDDDGTEYVTVNKEFSVLQRTSNSEGISVTVDNAVNTYTGNTITPVVVVKDTKRAENEQTLVRDKDYVLGYMEDGAFVAVPFVSEANDTAKFGQSESGEYEVKVQFIGNYTSNYTVNETENAFETAAWKINQIGITPLTITVDSDLVYDTEPHPVTVTTDDGTVPEGVSVYYGGADSTATSEGLTETAPTAVGTYKAFIKLNNTANYAFADDQETEITFEVTPRDIDSEAIEITYPKVSVLDGSNDGWTTCAPIHVYFVKEDKTKVELVEGTDYQVDLNRTNKVKDNIPVLINGKGNFTGNTYLDWSVVAPENAAQVDFDFIETYVKDDNNVKQHRIKFNATTTVAEGFSVVETGVIYYNAATGEPINALTIDNVDGTNIKKACKADDTYLVGLLDNGKGVYARFYSKITNGYNNYVVYATDEAEYYNYTAIVGEAAKAATTLDVEFIETYVSAGKNRIKFNATTEVKEGYTVKETGAIYFNAAIGEPAVELTMTNVDGETIKKAGKAGGTYLVGLLDNGNGVHARFYSIVTDGTNDYVVYATEEAKEYNYAALTAQLS